MKTRTLGYRLFIRILPTIFITILFIGLFALRSATKEINLVYDAQLVNDANVLLALTGDELAAAAHHPKVVGDMDSTTNSEAVLEDSVDEYADSRMFRIWKSGRIMLSSSTALPESISQQKTGFSTLLYNRNLWRIYTLPVSSEDITIEVGEEITLRDTLVYNILLDLALPLLLLIPLIGFLLWIGIGNGLGTIRTLVDQIRSRSPNDLSPMDIAALPHDLAPLGKSINQLFIMLEHSFTAERRFADHAAHQLRTPLAALKLQLQMLAKAHSEPERIVLIAELLESNERAAGLVNKLLTSARVSHQPIELSPTSLRQTLESVLVELGPLATQKHIELALEGEDGTVLADAILLRLMCSNLIENAIKYTLEGGQVTVSIYPHQDKWRMDIEDTGPGIAIEERTNVFEHFYRIGTPEYEGSGLGLSIVAEIVSRFSGEIRLETPASAKGLLVCVTLPKA